MNYLSICSGVEAASLAWEPLGWSPWAFSEIEPAACAVLAHHWPQVPNLGDMTRYQEWPDAAIDVLVGGTPCQSFSVAGLRKGLSDPRGNLMLVFGAIAGRYRPEWLVWENVPGVLSSNGGRDFGAFLGMLAELGYGFAYRVLDAQHFGVPQRRRRVFVVGHLGDWRRAAAVLFERKSLSGHPAPRRETGQSVAGTLAPGAHPGGFNGRDSERNLLIAHTLRGDGFDASEDGTGRGKPLVFDWQSGGDMRGIDLRPLAQLQASQVPALLTSAVRRLTPRECERLQGMPDDHTLVPYRGKPMADGPRYRMIGNSMAVPCMTWLGQRIQQVASITADEAAA